jgi:Protein of unknown function (DUF1573)
MWGPPAHLPTKAVFQLPVLTGVPFGLTGNHAGTFLFAATNGVLSQLQVFAPPYQGIYVPLILSSPSTPFLLGAAVTQAGQNFSSEMIATDGSLSSAPGSPYTDSLGTSAMAVTGAIPMPNAPAILINPMTLPTIGPIVTGATGTANFTITNSGYAPLNFTSIQFTGDPSFSQTNTCGSTIASGASCTVIVDFAPTTAGTFSGTVVITSNSPTRTVAIMGASQNPYAIPIILPNQQTLFPDTAQG